MKTVFKVLCGVLVTGTLLLTAACGGGGGSSGALGEEVSFSPVQVYDGGDNEVNLSNVTLTEIFRGDDDHEPVGNFFDPIPELSMTNGILTLEFGAPKPETLTPVKPELPAGVTVSPENADCFNLMSFYVESGGKEYDLGMGKGEDDLAVFVYVTADCTINGSGTIEGDMTGIWDLDLKAGWNTVLVTMNHGAGTMTQKSGGLNGYRWYMTERGNQS